MTARIENLTRLVLLAFLAGITLMALAGCGIKQTRPDGTYPKHPETWRSNRRGMPTIGFDQARCFGGGIGGCSMGGKAQ
jgi:hypothetical protein